MNKIVIRRLLCIFVTAVTLAAPFGTLAAANIPVYQVDGAMLFFDKATGEITGFAGEPSNFNIPAAIGGYRVTAIGSRAFRGCQSLHSLSVPDTVVTIGQEAFADCPNLTDVFFAGRVENVADDAFSGTPWANNTYDEYVIAGGTLLLRYNGGAAEAGVPWGITRIAPYAFAYNSGLQRVVLPEGLVEIGDNAFLHCYSLSDITIPSTLAYVGIGAFDDTIWLRNQNRDFVDANGVLLAYRGEENYVCVPDNITSIGSGAFMSNDRIVAVVLPPSVTTVGEAAFSQAFSLRTAVLPSTIQWIGDYAFFGSEAATVYGDSGSYAEYYASLYGLSFSPNIQVAVNGQWVYFDVPPVAIEETTYAPMRAILEAMGFEVQWSPGRVTAVGDGVDVVLNIGSDVITVNGQRFQMPAAPLVMSERVLLPVRAISEALGASVQWDGASHAVIINY